MRSAISKTSSRSWLIISTAVPTASAEKIFRFDGPIGVGDAGGPTVESTGARNSVGMRRIETSALTANYR